jgi:magnesium transporter
MITISMTKKTKLEPIQEITSNCWINMVNPTEDEVSRISEKLSIPRDFLTAALDVDERSRTDKEGNTILILWRIPYYQGQSHDIPFTTIPFSVILIDSQIITVCKEESDIIEHFTSGRVPGFSTVKRNRFILQLFLFTAKKYLSDLRTIDRGVDLLEDQLQKFMRNEELLEILKYQKSLVYFTTSLKSNELMMERIQRSHLFEMHPDDSELLKDVLIENRQATEMVDISNDILSQMMDAFASMISNNLNVVMKFLASVTIILTLPTLVASFYGMNVTLPLQNTPHAFYLTLFISFAISVVAVIIFLKKKWF